ncbi:hypothetical protein SAMN05216327_115178 [Dyadobacter sp. SG02]|uniref:hypothetical protein n=1 Tax=Dyadobacter sp. SG02 TaxID=1855291 RepID=UPI0008B2E376|nr:hypothetical protein [Dyadobacter sp. SG02]SEJ66890.1 hypothetical protein SAMN05216327_115178 [Dyadobacter sp. SG02]
MTTFTINFVNNSDSSGSFCVFQQNHNSPNPSVFPLAWRVEKAAAHSQLAISWNMDLYFFWGKTGPLKPGVVFNAGENSPTSMTEDNQITLTKEAGNYKFVNKKNWYEHGSLNIMSDHTTAINQASVGIGLSGAVAFAVQAQPNMNFLFAPRFDYWITFADIEQGQVLNPSDLNAVKIEFPYGIFSMNATLNADGTWAITPGLD